MAKEKKQSDYGLLLKDPRWQKKRLTILERDNWTCQVCQSTTETLHVHHKTYTYGKAPWDYIDTNLISLCATCHEMEEHFKQEFNGLIHDLLNMGAAYSGLYEHIKNNAAELIKQKP